MTAKYHYSVKTIGQSSDYQLRWHPTGAHHPYHPYIRWHLETGDAGQVGTGIGTPVTTEGEDFGFKFSLNFFSILQLYLFPLRALTMLSSCTSVKPLCCIALLGQAAAQSPQPLHRAALTSETILPSSPLILDSFSSIASKGHTKTQVPHPLQIFGSTVAVIASTLTMPCLKGIAASEAAAYP